MSLSIPGRSIHRKTNSPSLFHRSSSSNHHYHQQQQQQQHHQHQPQQQLLQQQQLQQQHQQQQRSASNSSMSPAMNSNQHQRKSLFHHQRARSVARSTRSRTNQASLYPPRLPQATELSTRASACGLAAAAAAAAAANNPNHHPAPMQNNNNYNEMSQISQLSMDSSFGKSQSQSTATNGNNFVDGIPLRQPSASMTMTSHSSASSSRHQQRYLYQPNENHAPSFDFHNGGNMSTTNSSNCIQNNKNNDASSSGDHQIKSSLQKKKKTKMQKTRFSNAVDHGGVGGDTHSMSQGSYSSSYASSASASHSASKSLNGSHRSHHSGNGRPVATNTTYDHNQARKQQQQQQHIAILNNRGGIGGRSLLTRSGADHSRLLLTRECRNNQRSSPIPLLQDPTFAKAATPRKRCNVPYPPLDSELKHQHELLLQQQLHLKQQQQQQQIHEHRVGITTATMASSNMAEERDQESYTSRRNEEKDEKDADNDNNLHDTGSTGNTNQHHHGHRRKENEKYMALLDSTRETKVDPTTTTDSNDGDVSGRFSSHQHTSVASANTTDSLVSVEQKRQRLLSEVESLEVRKKQDMEEIENRIVMEIQKQLEEKKLELFTQMQSKVETATSDAEGKLNQKVKAILEVTTSKLDQKHDDIEKKITATASTILEKLEVSVEEGCAKLSNFTETLINNIRPILNASLSSLHFSSSSSSSSSEKVTPKKIDATIGPVVDEQQHKKMRRLEDASLDRGRLEDASAGRISSGRSQKKDTVENSSSSTIFEGAVSLTQGSRQSGVDKASVRSRRSKRERKDDNGVVENNHPVTKAKRVKKVSKNETKDKKDCPSHTHNKKKKKTMVTPPASKYRSRRKKKGGNQKLKVAVAPATKKEASDRTDAQSSAKAIAVVPTAATTTDRNKKAWPADSKNDRKSGSKKGKIPSEIIMASDWELSPYLEGSFGSSKSNSKPPSVSSSVTKKCNTKRSFSKRKSTDPLLSSAIN
jgi:hypothetical protein